MVVGLLLAKKQLLKASSTQRTGLSCMHRIECIVQAARILGCKVSTLDVLAHYKMRKELECLPQFQRLHLEANMLSRLTFFGLNYLILTRHKIMQIQCVHKDEHSMLSSTPTPCPWSPEIGHSPSLKRVSQIKLNVCNLFCLFKGHS